MKAMPVHHPDRRQVLAFGAVAALFGGALIAPLARAAAIGAAPGFTAANSVLSPAQRAFVTAYSERIIPTTDTPGAVEAGVPDYIDMMLGDWFNPVERAAFLAGVSAIDAYAGQLYGKSLASLAPDQQDAIITALMTGKIAAAPADFYEGARQMIITGYYTSEIGQTVERVYLPVPGDYDGAYPYARVGRIFSGA